MNAPRRMSVTVVTLALAIASVLCVTGGVAAAVRPAATPIIAVQRLTVQFSHQGTNYLHLPCKGDEETMAKCPITKRLRADLARYGQWEGRHGVREGANVFCRCQNDPLRISLGSVSRTGSSARVPTVWNWSPAVHFTFVLRKGPAGWLIDNEFCTGHPASDLYHFPIWSCPTPPAAVTVKLQPIGHGRVRGTVKLTAAGTTTIAIVRLLHLPPNAHPFAVIHTGKCSDLRRLSASSLFLPALREDAHGTAAGTGRVHGPDAGGWDQSVPLWVLLPSGGVVVISTRSGIAACGPLVPDAVPSHSDVWDVHAAHEVRW